jgi:hypothetical protein
MSVTQIPQRQIADGAINDAKVAAGAGIVSSKLADGANFIKKDGTVTMTGTLNMGTQLISSLQTPSASTDAATKGYVDTQISNLNSLFDSKGSAVAASTGNILVSNPGTAVFDTITLATNDRLFLRAQTAPAENGIYVFGGSGVALVRVTDMDVWAEIPGAFFAVEKGAVYADSIWLCTADGGGTLGTTAITFQQIPTSAGLNNTNFVDKEVPSGSINSSNVTFTLANTPVAGSEHVYLNGVLQESGASNDYTVSGAVITYLSPPLTGEKLRVTYRK